MKKLHLDEMKEEVDNVTDWMVKLVLWVLIFCMLILLAGLIIFGV